MNYIDGRWFGKTCSGKSGDSEGWRCLCLAVTLSSKGSVGKMEMGDKSWVTTMDELEVKVSLNMSLIQWRVRLN